MAPVNMVDSSLDPNANRWPRVVLICVVFTALAAVFVVLRIWTRLGIVRNTGPDDWIITGSLVSHGPQHSFFMKNSNS